MADRTVKVRLEAAIGPYQRAMAEATAATRKLSQEEKDLLKATDDVGRGMQRVGRGMIVAGAGIAAGMGLAVKAAIDYETAFAGVRKTTDATEAQFAEISEGIREMSRRMPASAVEIAAVAEAAGQLGVRRGAILSFTETMIQLAATTNLTAEQAAVAMARIANIMQIPQSEVANLGATLVELGNNGASTESEILDMATRIASAGRQIGLSSADVLAFANALSSVGIESEAGGTAISRVMIEVQNAVMDGGEALGEFAGIAGMTQAQFSNLFKNDPSEAIVRFIEGLRQLGDAGGNVNAVLEQLGLSDIRVGNALRAAAGAGDLFRSSLDLAGDAFKDNDALAEEYRKRLETTGAQLEVLKNQIVDVAISFGDEMMPAVRAVAEVLASFVSGISAVSDFLGPLGPILIGLVGTLSLLGGAFFLVWSRIIMTQAAMATLTSTAPALAASLKTVMVASGGIGLALAAAAAAYAIFGGHAKAATSHVDDFTQALREQADGAKDAVRALIIKKLVDEDLDVAARKAGISLDTIAGAIEGDTEALKAFKDATDAVAGGDDATLLPRGQALKALRDAVLGLSDDLDTAKDKEGRAADAAKELGVETEGAADAFGDATSELDKFNDALDSYLGKVLGVQEAGDGFATSLIDLATQLRDNTEQFGRAGASLLGMSEAAIDNREAMGQAVQRAADWVKMMTEQDASQDEIRAGLAQMAADLVATATAFGVPKAEAETYAKMLLGIPTSVDTKVSIDTSEAQRKVQDLINQLTFLGVMVDPVGVALAYGSGMIPGEVPSASGTAAAPRAESGKSIADQAEDYLRALHEQEEERKRMEEAVNSYLRALYQHRMEIEDNMYAFDAMSKDRYLQILQERLAGLEEYSNEWVAVMRKIMEVRDEAMNAQLDVIRAFEEGRQWQLGFDQLADQRLMYNRLTPAAGATASTTYTYGSTYNVNQTIASSNPYAAATTANEQLRNYAAMAG